MPARRTAARRRPKLIHLHTCACSHCKGRGAVCMDAFDWVDKRDPAHALRHAREDLNDYFDGLPAPIKDALNKSDVNVCSWCAQIWTGRYGIAKAVQLIRDVRYIDADHAIAPFGGWKSLQQAEGRK